MTDQVDEILRQWAAVRPDLDVSPMGVIGRMSRLSLFVRAELQQTFAAHDLDASSFDVLATLRRSGPPYRLAPAELTRSSMVTSGAITQRLDRLEARGLLVRAPSVSDGRGVDVSLTEFGKKLIDDVLPDHLDTENRLLSALSVEERRQLESLLSKLLTSLGDTPEGSAGTDAHGA